MRVPKRRRTTNNFSFRPSSQYKCKNNDPQKATNLVLTQNHTTKIQKQKSRSTMRHILVFFALLSASASAFLPRAHVTLHTSRTATSRSPPSSSPRVGWMLAAEARNVSDVSKVGDYRDSSVPTSRMDRQEQLPKVRDGRRR